MVEPRWELKIGSPVVATDGDYGRLHNLILDPYQGRVVALIVRQHGPPPFHSVVVPEEEVADATDNGVRLKISHEQLDALPEYKSGIGLVVEGQKYLADDKSFAMRGALGILTGHPPIIRHGKQEGQIVHPKSDHLALQIRASQDVFCQDGQVGKVSLLLLDPSGQVKGFVLHTGRLLGLHLIVPTSWIQAVDSENVHLSVEKAALNSLPVYGPDMDLMQEVENALWADQILRETDYQEISVSVENEIVTFRGHVVMARNRTIAEEAARQVQGVLGIENQLVVDNDLVIDVAQALGNDKRTRSERISVGARNGVITLYGQVKSSAIRKAAEEVAASIRSVRGVANYIQAPNVIIDPLEEEVMEPPIGREAFATDMLLGLVGKVVINPHNRRVTAFVVHGYFPEMQYTSESDLTFGNVQPERSAVVPIHSVRYETDSSVELDVSSVEAARNHDFNPADYVSPPEDWQPPYPYHREDVLFLKERKNEPKS